MFKKTRTKSSKSPHRRVPSGTLATSEAKTSKAKTSKAKTSKAKTSKAKTSKAKTAKAKTAKAKTAKAKTAKAKTASTKTTGRPETKTRPDQPASRSARNPAKAAHAAGRGKSTTHTPLKEGARAPSFRLPRDGGGTVSLSDLAGRKLVLFFYPRASTPGCTKESVDFSRLSDAFARCQTAVVGISADPVRAQEAFRDTHGLTVPLLSDETHTTLKAYGAWGERSLYGRTFLGIIRSTVLIGADGRIRRIWRHVKVDGHAGEVLAAATAAD